MLTPTIGLAQSILANSMAKVTAGNFTGALNAPYVILFTGNPTITPSSVLADLTEATYTGYARQQILTWSTPYVSQDGSAAIDSPALQFLPSGTITVTNNITGWALVSAATAGVLLGAEMLPAPKALATVADSLTIIWKAAISPYLGLGYGVFIF